MPIGAERTTNVASFSVGEGGGNLVRAAKPPVIDGKLDDWKAMGSAALLGSISDATQISAGEAKTWSGPADLSANIYAAWDKDALYVAVDVTDDKVIEAPASSDPWDWDSIELFFDGRAPFEQYQQQPSEGVYQIGISPAGAGGVPTTKVLARRQPEGWQTATTRTAKGYIVEMRVPLSATNFPAGEWRNGRSVKMSVLVNDRDDAATAAVRENVLGWRFSPQGRNFNDTSGWKVLVLSDKK